MKSDLANKLETSRNIEFEKWWRDKDYDFLGFASSKGLARIAWETALQSLSQESVRSKWPEFIEKCRWIPSCPHPAECMEHGHCSVAQAPAGSPESPTKEQPGEQTAIVIAQLEGIAKHMRAAYPKLEGDAYWLDQAAALLERLPPPPERP